MEKTQIAPNLFVGPQIVPDDLELLAREGFTDVVCNRPDAEHHESSGSLKMAEIAKRQGLQFHYLPISHAEPLANQAQKLSQLTAQTEAKIFAYCRSGARSTHCWSISTAGEPETGSAK